MANKKSVGDDEVEPKKEVGDIVLPDDDTIIGEDSIDASMIEETFNDDYSEYNDVDNF